MAPKYTTNTPLFEFPPEIKSLLRLWIYQEFTKHPDMLIDVDLDGDVRPWYKANAAQRSRYVKYMLETWSPIDELCGKKLAESFVKRANRISHEKGKKA